MYFRMSSLRPSKCKGTLKFDKAPPVYGNAKDIDGKMWNFSGFAGGCYLVALTECLDPYWGSTATNSFVGHHHQTWYPYKVEIDNPEPGTKSVGGFWFTR